MRKLISFTAGSVIGGLVGATLVLLLTPVSGDKLRNQLTEVFDRFQSEVKQAAISKRAELENQLAELRKPYPPDDPSINL